MPNLSGINGSGTKQYPPDDVLQETLLKYVRRGLKQKEKLARLVEDHQLEISVATLNKIERRLEIPSVRRNRPSQEVAVQAVIDEVEKDIAQNNGPNYVKTQLQQKLILVPRNTIRRVMQQEFPSGPDIRYPGRKKSQVFRTPLSALGPYHEISSDGHEKLGAQALQMGGVGLPIYAFKDKWTAQLLKINVIPNDRTNAAIGHLFLDFVAENGGIGMQMTVDKGSEIGWMLAIQDCLRETFAPNIDLDIYPPHACVKSVHNTIIEAFWRWLKVKRGLSLREHVLRGKNEHIFDEGSILHSHLFNWLFPPLIQAELDEFRQYWNSHKIRFQPEKIMPSGHIPSDAAEYPQLFGGINCFIKVPASTVEDIREVLSAEVGPREQHLSWVTPEFDTFARTIYEMIERPTLTLESSWTVFVQMSDKMDALGQDTWPAME
ncbi:hypothetical protein MIND_00400200 [Mycena indigotica]|uniref:Integrase core domain-containing protein n=1 Tax=Mycena indigotica TaxID=2126181 RepID=A0A8H6WCZ3_9AGAR|nr:uncharacterized protein MIND_00400200 [Mycena indigotica]KAF7310263.1 hypothetical protein MIND_00400200 [Mycena indigotica]